MANLTNTTAVQTNLFVRLQIDEYRTSDSGSYTQEVLRFSDYTDTWTINSESYLPLGNFLGITPSTSTITPSSNSINVTISGIPNSSLAEIVHSRIKGSPIEIYRVFIEPGTFNQISAAQGRFIGQVINYTLDEEYDVGNRTASNIIQLECASNVDLLSNKIAGRQTNPFSQNRFYPNDTSMDRVPSLKETKFNFGAP